jgi:hypothetical protein
LEKTKKRVLAYHYSPTGKMFHVVAKIKDEPRALGKVLDKLGENLDFITDLAYNTEEKTAIFSGFAKPTSAKVDLKMVEKLLKSLPVVLDSEVSESQEGILVDTLHSGIEIGGDRRFALFPVDAMSRTFGEIITLMGSGAETILYNEGVTLGSVNTELFVAMLGPEVQKKIFPYTANVYGALGWGKVTVAERKTDGSFTTTASSALPGKRSGRGAAS